MTWKKITTEQTLQIQLEPWQIDPDSIKELTDKGFVPYQDLVPCVDCEGSGCLTCSNTGAFIPKSNDKDNADMFSNIQWPPKVMDWQNQVKRNVQRLTENK